MATNETVWIPESELRQVVEPGPQLQLVVSSLRHRSPGAVSMARNALSRRGEGDRMIAHRYVQQWIHDGTVVLREEPQQGSTMTPSPQAFLGKYGLTRPESK